VNFRWASLAAFEYAIETQRDTINGYQTRNELTFRTSGDGLQDDRLYTTRRIPENGRYRARIRTLNPCGGFGPWSEWSYFSQGGALPVVDVPVVVPPVEPPYVPPVVPVTPPYIPPVTPEFSTHVYQAHFGNRYEWPVECGAVGGTYYRVYPGAENPVCLVPFGTTIPEHWAYLYWELLFSF
jgi:hypothetical protein